MDGTDGMDRGLDRGLDRRLDRGRGWWSQGRQPDAQGNAQGSAQSGAPNGTQDGPYAGQEGMLGRQPAGLPDPREVPALQPGRFLRSQPPGPPVPAEDATPTRSVPVLSRPGAPPAAYSPYGASNGVPGGAAQEWAPLAPGAGLGQGSAQSHGTYVVEETQELVLPPAAPNANVAPAGIEESSAPRPRVVNAAGAAAAAYQQFDQTGSFAALRPGAEQARGAGEFGRNGAMASRGAGASAAPPVPRGGTNPLPAPSAPVGGSRWQEPAAGAGGGYAVSPAPAGAMGAPRPSGMGGATGAPPQQYGAVAPHAGASLFGPALDRGTVTIALSANTAAALSYLFGFLTGIFFYFGERDNRYVRFHAWQSSALSLILILLGVITYGGVWLVYIKVDDPAWNLFALLVAGLIGLAMLVLWLWTMAEAWTGHYVRLPIIGHWAEYFATTPHDLYDQGAGA